MSEQDKPTQLQIGGNLTNSLTQGFKLDLKNVFAESFQLTLKNLSTLLLAGLAAVGFMMLVASVLVHGGELLGLIKEVVDEEGNPVIFTKEMVTIALLMSVFVIPSLIAGFTMMSINHVVGLKSKPLMVFDFFKYFGPLAIAFAVPNMLSMLFMNLGLGLFAYFPSIYISAIFSLVIPLMIERKMSVIQAVPLSIRVVHKGLGQLFIIHAVINVLMVVAVMTVIGLAFVIPFAFTLQALIYREVCGIRLSIEVAKDKGEFSA
ncbi:MULTISPECIES: hypothetical protein [unclassified Motilimonas]|uniref:hypothetical protein n=1 Tax=Motilimonas TaxID=1914248 RepID=UPI001E4B3A56|nr:MULTISPECIES: hypothetical protein [unclassified Motilimonas]MCE0558783.1 hypothetical protein [Motilimonas sp. E26]MDO6527241.1 hypothetical protein [Motilimonas sp. 1_MG-2023]